MSHELVICLVAVAANLAGTLLIYALLSHAITQFTWRHRGLFRVIALLVIAQLFWIAPALGIVEAQGGTRVASYALWFGNWLVSGFGLALFLKSAARIPAALGDAARMDGLGGLGLWRHAVLPFVRRDLIILALLTSMATLLPFWAVINQPETDHVIAIPERGSSFAAHLVAIIVASLVGVIPLVVIFFAAKKSA